MFSKIAKSLGIVNQESIVEPEALCQYSCTKVEYNSLCIGNSKYLVCIDGSRTFEGCC